MMKLLQIRHPVFMNPSQTISPLEYIYIYIHILLSAIEHKQAWWNPTLNHEALQYRSKVWGHLEYPYFLKKSTVFFNEDNIKCIINTV